MRPTRLVGATRWAEEPSHKPRQGPSQEGRAGGEKKAHGCRLSRARPTYRHPTTHPLARPFLGAAAGASRPALPLLSLLPDPSHPHQGSFFSCTPQTSPALLTTAGRPRLQQWLICFSLRNTTPRQGHPVQPSARVPSAAFCAPPRPRSPISHQEAQPMLGLLNQPPPPWSQPGLL